MALTRPAKFVKSKVLIADGQGRPLGEIVQQNAIGKIRFALEAGGQTLGRINAENWRAWNFSIEDHTGTEVARITKTWEGLAKTLFTDGGQLRRPDPPSAGRARCAPWSSPAPCASTSPSSRTTAASTEPPPEGNPPR